MKKLFASIMAPLLTPLFFLLPKAAHAQELNLCPPEEEANFFALCNITTGNFGGVIGTAIVVIFVIAIIIALIWLIIGGIKWITSSGDSSKVEGARNQIIAAVIGLVIVFLSFFILNFVLTVFGFENGVMGIDIPSIDDLDLTNN